MRLVEVHRMILVGHDLRDEETVVEVKEFGVPFDEGGGDVILVCDGLEDSVSLVFEEHGVGEDHPLAELVHLGLQGVLVLFEFCLYSIFQLFGVHEAKEVTGQEPSEHY